jgi:hypothetical protein
VSIVGVRVDVHVDVHVCAITSAVGVGGAKERARSSAKHGLRRGTRDRMELDAGGSGSGTDIGARAVADAPMMPSVLVGRVRLRVVIGEGREMLERDGPLDACKGRKLVVIAGIDIDGMAFFGRREFGEGRKRSKGMGARDSARLSSRSRGRSRGDVIHPGCKGRLVVRVRAEVWRRRHVGLCMQLYVDGSQ